MSCPFTHIPNCPSTQSKVLETQDPEEGSTEDAIETPVAAYVCVSVLERLGIIIEGGYPLTVSLPGLSVFDSLECRWSCNQDFIDECSGGGCSGDVTFPVTTVSGGDCSINSCSSDESSGSGGDCSINNCCSDESSGSGCGSVSSSSDDSSGSSSGDDCRSGDCCSDCSSCGA